MKIETPIQITEEGVEYHVPINNDIEILYSTLPANQQYWRREDVTDKIPQFFYDYNPHLLEKDRCKLNAAKTHYKGEKLVSLSVEDTIELTRILKREKDRMTYGVYIMNNGETIYFPGIYYGVLRWCKMFGQKANDGYGEHREYQRVMAYVHDLAEKDEDMDGYYCHKVKKSGITMEITLFILVKMMINREFTAAAMSKVFDTAKKANFKYFMHSLKNLPPILRPKTEQKSWQNAVQKIDLKCSEPEMSAENTFAVVTTTIDGLDGLPVIQVIHLDEPPKFPPSASIDQVYTKSKEQARTQQVKQGIIAMSSYPPEEDTDAFKWCRQFYAECCKLNPLTKKPINRMIAFFIGIAESSNGTFDKYGKPDRVKALSEEKAARELCKNDAELQARKRQYAITAKEGWQSGGSGSVYNNLILTEREAELEDLLKVGRNYVEGNLEWTAGRFSPVRFVPLSHDEIMKGKTGKWRFFIGDGDIEVLAEWFEKNTNKCFTMPKKIRFKDGLRHLVLQPTDYVTAVGGVDPVDYRLMSEMGATRSTNCSISKTVDGDLISVYYDRDENPDVNLEDFCLEIVFLGKYTLVEANKGVAYTTLDKEGLCYFLLVKHPNGEIRPYAEKITIKPVSSSSDLIKTYITLTTKVIKNSPEKLRDYRVIKQHKDFEADNTKKYDMSVADGLSNVSVDVMQTWVTSKKSKFGKYENLKVAASAIL